MGARQILKGVLPVAAFNSLKRATAVRRAGAQFGPAELLSVRRARWLKESRVASFPPGAARPGGVVVDVGAHEGRWAEAALRTLRPTRLIAVEPNPTAFQRLSERLGAKPCVELHQCAVGDRNGRTELHTWSRSDFNSLLALRTASLDYYPGLRATGSVPVSMTTLDELLAGVHSVQVLKIDVQGAESAVLRGGEETLRRTKLVILETNFTSHYNDDSLFADLHALMNDIGFYLHQFASQYLDSEGRLLWADTVYVSR